MNVLAIDPGTTHSGFVHVLADGPDCRRWRILNAGDVNNDEMRSIIESCDAAGARYCAIEMIQGQGMAVGAETFQTCVWIGRFMEQWNDFSDQPLELVVRSRIKLHLCGSVRAKDANIRVALLDRFGPGKSLAVGLKKTPGPLFGVTGHMWQALAVAVTYIETSSSMASA